MPGPIDKPGAPLPKANLPKTYLDPKTGVEYILSQNNNQKAKQEYSVFGSNGHTYTYNMDTTKGFNKSEVDGLKFGSVSYGLQQDREEAQNIFKNLVKPQYTGINPNKPMSDEQKEAWNSLGISLYR